MDKIALRADSRIGWIENELSSRDFALDANNYKLLFLKHKYTLPTPNNGKTH